MEYNLFPNAGEDGEEGEVEREGGGNERERRHVGRDRRAVVVRV